jgi:hypothetical protein
MRVRGRLLLVLVLGLLALPGQARAFVFPGDPLSVGDDANGTPGNFFKAVFEVSLLDGALRQVTLGNALPQASAMAVTGRSALVTVGGQTVSRVDLESGRVVNVAAPTAGDMRGVGRASDGTLYAADIGPTNGMAVDGRVLRIDAQTGAATPVASGGRLNNPLGIAVADDGTIYVTDLSGDGHGEVLAIDPSVGSQRVVASAPLVVPWGIAFLPNGELAVADEGYNGTFRGALVRIDPATGAQAPLFLETLSVPIENATGVAVDDAGRVLLTERSSNEVDRVDLATGVAERLGGGMISPLDVEPAPGVGPTTTLTGGPTGATRDTTPTFTFRPSQYGAESSCEIDRGPVVPCRRTFTTEPLTPGQHSIRVASSRFGTEGPAVARVFTVDPNALDTLITSGPSGPTNDTTPTFTFVAPGGGTSFTCSLDAAIASPCSAPFTVPAALADGPHAFTVKANGDDIGDSRSFTVDTAPPRTTITSGPGEGAATGSTRPTFTFGSSESPSTFECTLDGDGAPCTSVLTPPAALAEGAHTLTVAAIDAAGNADPAPLVRHFIVDTTPPRATITGGPSGNTDIAAPTFTFTASEPGSTFRCSVDGVALTLCASPFTVSPALLDGPHSFRVQAIDSAGNSEAPVQRDFVVDTSVPETSITGGPIGLTNDVAPSFSFESTKPGSTFACSLDDLDPVPCESPFLIGLLGEGAHTFAVAATDAEGHPDPTPATRAFTVDTTPPETTITADPGPLTNDRTPEFAFASEPGALFSCRLDGNPEAPCASPFTAPPLGDGPHTLVVTATDEAGNADPQPAQRTFRIDTDAPETSIDSGPGGDTTVRRPAFSFSADEEGSSFGCSVDGGAATACAGVFQPPAPLPIGPHTFEVAATDEAGNVDQTPARRGFRVIPGGGEDPPAGPGPGVQPPPGRREAVAPQLSLRGSLRGSVLRLRVTVGPGATGRVAIKATALRAHLRRKLDLTLSGGLASARLHLPHGIGSLRLQVHYGGDASFLPASTKLMLRQGSRRR